MTMPSRSSPSARAQARCTVSRDRNSVGSSSPARSKQSVVIAPIPMAVSTSRASPTASADMRRMARSASVRSGSHPTNSESMRIQCRSAVLASSSTTSLSNADVSSYQAIQRSSARISARIEPTDGEPSGRRIGAGSSLGLRIAGRINPEARSCSSGLALVGTSLATSRPRSVTSMISPASARETTADARCCNALIPTLAMCVRVASGAGRRSEADVMSAATGRDSR